MAANNVVSLSGLPPAKLGEPVASMVNMLADILEMAKQGRLQSFVGTGFTSDGNRVAVWHASHDNVYEMLGSIAWIEHEYVARITDNHSDT